MELLFSIVYEHTPEHKTKYTQISVEIKTKEEYFPATCDKENGNRGTTKKQRAKEA